MPSPRSSSPTLRLGFIPALLLLGVATIGLVACKRAKEADPRQADRFVQVFTVQAAGNAEGTYTGLVAARVQSDLGFRVQGKVTERLVDTGEVVTRGQALMRIDATDYAHAITAQLGNVASAKAQAVQAIADEKRYRGLVASGAISSLVYDQAKAQADSAQALLSAAEAQAKVARNQGDYSVLLADADGTVVETLVEPGQVVSAGQVVIRLAHAGPREAAVNLPETARPALGSAAQASLYGDTTQVSSHLRQLSDAADPQTRTYEARYVLDGVGADAPLGATVKVTLLNAPQANAMQVPIGAVDDEGSGPGVWVLDPKAGSVAYRPVRVGVFGLETVVLTGGVRVGDVVVASGGHYLHPDEHVRVVGEKAIMQ